MTDELDALAAVIREDCPRAIWSQGVSLARSASITVEPSDDDDEIVLRFTLPGVAVARTIRLLVEEEDYVCDCSPLDDACEHVAASIIMYRKAIQSGMPLPMAKAGDGRVSYALIRSGGGVGLRRTVEVGGQHLEVKGAVLSFARRADLRITTGPTDLELERHLGPNEFNWIPPGKMKGTLKLLSRLSSVLFDGRKVDMSQRPIGAVARLVDAPKGFLLSVIQNPLIDEVFNNSVVRCGDTFRPLRDVGLTARELQIYRKGRVFTDGELSELMSVVLPDLRGRIDVDTEEASLPSLVDAPAHVEIHVQVEGHELVVAPCIAYGDPAIARVISGSLDLLGDVVPERDREREFSLYRQIRHDLQIDPHQETRFAGENAVVFTDRLKRWQGKIHGMALNNFELLGALQASVSLKEHGDDLKSGGQVAVHFDFALPGQAAKRASPSAVLSAWQANESLVPLLDGGWASLPVDWLARCGEIASHLLRARDERGVVPKSSLLDVARLCDSMDVDVPALLLISDASSLTLRPYPRLRFPRTSPQYFVTINVMESIGSCS